VTAIAGILYFDKRPVDPKFLKGMQDILEPYGPDAQHVWHESGVCLLRNLRRITPEDALDSQPLMSSNRHMMLVFDGRIYNREELAETMEIPHRRTQRMADSAFVLKAFERWEENCLERLLGDFALAIWHKRAERLFLARDPMGHRPLYWYKDNEFFAFATLSKGLFAIPGVPRQLCEERMADYLALLPMKGSESFYKDIFRIEPGHFLVVEKGQVHTRRYHHFDPEHQIVFKNENDYVEAGRELLSQAVRCRLRSTKLIGAHLSSGLDSSTVAATAAGLLQAEGKSLLAFTAVPRKGFHGPVPKGWHADEGPAAAALAARFPNMDHILFRPGGRTPMDDLSEKVQLFDRAPLNPCNLVWFQGIQADAAQRNCNVLLTGQMGNMTISYDGRPRLANLLRRGRWFEWLREIRATVLPTDTRLRGAIMQSVGPFLPIPLWRAINARRGRVIPTLNDYTAIHPDLIRRTNLYQRALQAGWDLNYRPWSDGWKMRTIIMYRMDQGDNFTGSVGGNGIELRDPTSDLRLVKFCLAIPEDQYFKNGQSHRLLHRLMKHTLPPEILNSKTRGLQAADWYEGTSAAKDEIKAWLDVLEATSEAPKYLNLKRMRMLFENWPRGGWERSSVVQNYRFLLLHGLSVGAFIHYVEKGNR